MRVCTFVSARPFARRGLHKCAHVRSHECCMSMHVRACMCLPLCVHGCARVCTGVHAGVRMRMRVRVHPRLGAYLQAAACTRASPRARPRAGHAPSPGPPWKVQRPEPSCKPKSEYQPSDTPFEKETQYQKDFRAWPIPKRGDHPWIPKPGPSPAPGLDGGFAERRRKAQPGAERSQGDGEAGQEPPKGGEGRAKAPPPAEQPAPTGPDGGRGRAAADALNRQIKQEAAAGVSSSYRNEFRPWIDVKPVKAIKAKAQYKPPEEKMTHETSYSAQFKGETSKPAPADNKFLERRRIRTLYSEPYKEPPKVEKPSVKPSKPKKTTTSHKPLKKAKDKQIASGRAAKKKSAETSNTAKPEDKEKSKEMNNKLAEAKE
uniref:MAP6 protein n=1 Tax=Dromaius novaehollandiae TaxID=8790 RepID=A0A8C4JGX1_DRONO